MAYNKQSVLRAILSCTDTKKLQNWIDNARREGAPEVEKAAITQLINIEAQKNHDDPNDPVVFDFWKSITALEYVLSDERGKTTRLSRTRQKITRVGVKKTLKDLVMSPTPSDGYYLLQDRGMLEMSAESVVLRHLNAFHADIIEAAKQRLANAE